MSRLKRLRQQLDQEGLDAFLTLKVENVFYLSRFTGDTGAVLITADSAIFFADSRFELQASQEAADFQVVPVPHGYTEVIGDFIAANGLKRIGIEANHLNVSGYEKLQALIDKDALLEPKDKLVEKLRMIKEPTELEIMKTAVELTEEAFQRLLPLVKAGVSEHSLQVELIKLMYDVGFSGPDFDYIVASGERGALPHGVASDRVIGSGELITFDFGGMYRRYCSDMTRTVAVGDVSPELRKVYETVRLAQDEAEKAAGPGMTGKDLDEAARRVIVDAGYGQYFGHGLGHGVGLEVHELPVASPRGEEVLQPGMVVTIEPGIYIPGTGGVRIENEIVITESGAESWNRFGKELLVL